MTAHRAPDDLARRLEDEGYEHLWVVYTDYNGRTQGKSAPRSRFGTVVEKGITFARANLGHNLRDHSPADTAFAADSGDFFAVPDPNAVNPYPLMPDTARVLCWMRQEGGDPWDGCPRTRLQRQIDAFASRGIGIQSAFEPEGYFFRIGEDGSLQPGGERGMFSIQALESEAEVLHAISDTLLEMGVDVEQVAPEWGPGQFEVNLKHAAPMRAADNLITTKDVIRAIARQAGLVASFMPKPSETMGGCGLHVHLSLTDNDGASISEGEGHPSGLSELGQHFLAGILAHGRALVGVGSPTPNSYKRLQPGSWAPAHAAYAISNRSSLVRIPGGKRRRVEFRSGDNTSSPYLFLAALLAAGMDGIERELPLGTPAEGDLGHMDAADLAAQGVVTLPRRLGEALDAVEADEVVMAGLGPVIGPEWLRVKRSELAEYETTVSDWERETYLRS
jgi:glutamine synthetase